MSPPAWRSLAITGTLIVAIAASVGHLQLQLAFQAASLLGAIAILVGVKKHKPQKRGPWYGFALSAMFFFGSYGLRLIFPSLLPQPSGNPTAADFVDALGYLAAIVSVHNLGQIRDRDKDPTTVIDALILTGGMSTIIWVTIMLPYAQNTRIEPSGRILGIALGILSIWLAFAAIRLMIGPGLKSTTSRLLTISALFGMIAEAATTASSAGAVGNAVLFFGAIALTYLGASALHPSMVRATEPTTRDISRMTKRRLSSMLVAQLIAPIVILVEAANHNNELIVYSGLVFFWIVVTSLTMVRFAGLVRAREHIANVEHALSRAAASLVSATDRDATYKYAVTAMAEVTGRYTDGLRACVVLRAENGWQTVCAWDAEFGSASNGQMDANLIPDALLTSTEPIQINHVPTFDNYHPTIVSLVLAPLISHMSVRGALVVSTSKPLPSVVVDALGSLASDVSLAVEAVGLSEDLHRRQSEQRFRSLVQHSSDLTAVLDQSGLINYLTPSVETLLGYSPESLIGTDLSAILHPEDRDVIGELANMLVTENASTKVLELRVKTSSDEWKVLEVTLTDLRNEAYVEGIVMNAHDITDRKALEYDLRHKVLHDDLTGIANRILFRDRVDHALRSLPYNKGAVTAVLFIDIDDFKTVNDGLGHDIGDELLKVIAFRLETFVRAGDTAARLGGDEFAALFEGMFTVEDVLTASRRLLEVLNQPIEFGRREITVSASVGVALAEDAMTSDVLLRNADVAMYHAKNTGKNGVKLFDQEMYVSAFERLELKADLAHALERNELSLHYQPLLSMQTNEIVGFEALMRWEHPTRGFVSPASFIPLAEETGFIVPIGAWAAQVAFTQLADWRNKYNCDIGMSVNVSPRQLDEDAIVEQIDTAIKTSGIDPKWVTLELTESSGLDDPTSRSRLIALRQLGCGIAADDFGTGFASYAALQQLPFTNVKIDRSLINGLSDNDTRAHAQVRSIIQMGHALGLSITAEGIEDTRQADSLRAMKADKAQGYLFGKPLPASKTEELLRQIAQAI